MDLQTLLDKALIEDLVLNYCRAADRRDFVRMRELYHDDAIDDHGEMFCGPVDDYIAWLPAVMAQFEATVHSISNSLILVDGDRAEGEHHAVAYHRTHPPAAQEVVIGGRYLDRYERRAGRWGFVRRALALDWCNVRPVNPDDYRQFAAGAALGRPDGSDPSYQQLTLFRRGSARDRADS